MKTLAWKLRVWGWRFGLVAALLSVSACELRRIKRDCLREIAAARTEAEVDTVQRLCNLQVERR